ncbi:endolytic transglycosylase MltG [Angustibacter aerolatus]
MADRDDLAAMLPGDHPVEGPGGPYAAPAPVAEPPLSRRDQRHDRDRARRRKQRRGRRTVVMLVAVVVVAGALFGAITVLKPIYDKLTASDDYAGSGSGSVTVTVAEGASATRIGETLHDAGVVKTSKAFVEAAADEPASQKIQPGEYTLRKQMSGAAAVSLLLDPSSRAARGRVTLREGLRQTQVVAALAKATGLPSSDYTKALKDPEAIGLPAAAKGKAEGWLFPDTYELAPDATATEQLKMLVARTTKVLDDLDVPEDERQTLLTKASIVQAEGGSERDFGKIATVIERRLANDLQNGGKLQFDSTVSYGTGRGGVFTTAAERADTKNLYNTYARAGLPVGPIGNPGEAAIKAVLDPTPGPWTYFTVVNLDTGETKFTTSYQQHLGYVQQLRDWIKAHPSK